MSAGEPRKLARLGLVMEFEDGDRVIIYADDLRDAQVTIATETPRAPMPWDYARTTFGFTRTSILVEGLTSYTMADRPNMADHFLKALDHGVHMGPHGDARAVEL